MVPNIVWDFTRAVVGPLPGLYVNRLVLGTTSDVVPKSPGPELVSSNEMIGIDAFVALSIAKTDAEKEYESSGAKY